MCWLFLKNDINNYQTNPSVPMILESLYKFIDDYSIFKFVMSQNIDSRIW